MEETHGCEPAPESRASIGCGVTARRGRHRDMSAEPAPLIALRDLSVRFGGIVALDGVGFEIREGEILGLIGPNGAGKTTLFNCLSRLHAPSAGAIEFHGRSILDQPAHRIAALGIGRTFQNLASFAKLSVRDNIRIGGHSASRSDPVSDALRLPHVRRRERRMAAVADDLIRWLQLEEVADLPVTRLPFGTQKRVELARALASGPRLLLLDEPAGGLNHDEVQELGRLIRCIRDERGVTVLLVEHHMALVMSLSDRVVVLNFGRKIAEGTPAEVQGNSAVVHAYLGGRL
jgi:branched-chain amino acid transport system ATP-binding protein